MGAIIGAAVGAGLIVDTRTTQPTTPSMYTISTRTKKSSITIIMRLVQLDPTYDIGHLFSRKDFVLQLTQKVQTVVQMNMFPC